MKITDAREGTDLVVETQDKVFFGRYEGQISDTILLKDAMEQPIEEGEDRERMIQELARAGFPREESFRAIASLEILRIRLLADVAAE